MGNTQNPALYKPQGTVTLNGTGTSSSPQQLEAMSADLLGTAAGFTNNFAYGTLILGSNTYVQLVDQSQNSTAGGHNALYVNSLVIPAGSTFNTNGLNVYARYVQRDGTVIGTINQIADAGPLALDSPTPGTIGMQGELDPWTFFGRAGTSVTAALDPGSGAAGGPVGSTLQWGQIQILDPSGTVIAGDQHGGRRRHYGGRHRQRHELRPAHC